MSLSTIASTTSILSCMDYVLYCFSSSSFRYPRDISNRLTCSLFQCYIVGFCVYNLLTIISKKNQLHPLTRIAENHLIGYFIYDSLVLLSSARGRMNYTYIIHHIISLFILAINSSYPCGTDELNNSIIILLEGSSPFLNVWKISQEINPNSIYTYLFHRISAILYYSLRIVGMTLWLLMYGAKQFTFTWNHLMNGTGFILIYIASLFWFRRLVKKG